MTIVEAFKQGRKVRNHMVGYEEWIIPMLPEYPISKYVFTVEQILDDSWEVEPKPPAIITLSKIQFDKAWETVFFKPNHSGYKMAERDLIAKELGLE